MTDEVIPDRFGESPLALFRLRRKPAEAEKGLTMEEWTLFNRWYQGEVSDEQLVHDHGMDMLERFQDEKALQGGVTPSAKRQRLCPAGDELDMWAWEQGKKWPHLDLDGPLRPPGGVNLDVDGSLPPPGGMAAVGHEDENRENHHGQVLMETAAL